MSKPSSATWSIVRIEKSVTTHCQTTSGVTCHHCILTAHTVERRRAWHAIITFGQHTWSNYVGRGMPSSPLGSTNGLTTSGVDCQHHLWAAHTVERRRAWHAIIALGQHTRSNNVRRDMPSHTIERRWAWHAIITFGQHKRSDDVGRGMPLSPSDGKHGRTTSGVDCHHLLWEVRTVDIVGRGMPSPP